MELELVCRQDLKDGPGVTESCSHVRHTRECCNLAVPGKSLPKGEDGQRHKHSGACCGHMCGYDGDCNSVLDYSPSALGAAYQCGATATFEGETMTAAEDGAVAAGWRVDSAWLGVFTRSDVCPTHNEHGYGARMPFAPQRVEDEPVVDTYAYAAA